MSYPVSLVQSINFLTAVSAGVNISADPDLLSSPYQLLFVICYLLSMSGQNLGAVRPQK